MSQHEEPRDPFAAVGSVRQVRLRGWSKELLLTQLLGRGVQLNAAGRTLFADERFTTSNCTSVWKTIETSVASLGFPGGATFSQFCQKAAEHGLELCPLELGPYLRIDFLDQDEGELGQPQSLHAAPPGSLTVVSQPLTTVDETPKGFYLRKIKGVLWLRGYFSTAEHVWNPQDRLIFACPSQRTTEFI